MTPPRRYWRYEVTEVWGMMVGKLDVGAVIVSTWKADRTWSVLNMDTGDYSGGWSGKLLGEASPEVAAQMHARRDVRRAKAVR